MFKEILTAHDNVFGLVCEGKLTKIDSEQIHAFLHGRLEGGTKPGLVLDLTQFEGYEKPRRC
ncbi:hypothetical protein [Roseovarius nanhaiticus]|uniref:hypothetical protein n=1 Tax=Roseovarius nanhaiticus TaxID=573024 RepID=UPI002490A4B4|nr:hypothetical protein [Roseovarius nanhaiticus]